MQDESSDRSGHNSSFRVELSTASERAKAKWKLSKTMSIKHFAQGLVLKDRRNIRDEDALSPELKQVYVTSSECIMRVIFLFTHRQQFYMHTILITCFLLTCAWWQKLFEWAKRARERIAKRKREQTRTLLMPGIILFYARLYAI